MELMRPSGDGYDEHVRSLAGACAFCRMAEHLDIERLAAWTWVYAAFPYRRYHTLLVPKRHVTRFSELRSEELSELVEAVALAEERYLAAGIVGEPPAAGGHLVLSWRLRAAFDPTKQSVQHLHLHLYPRPDGQHDVDLEEDAWDFDTGLLRRG